MWFGVIKKAYKVIFSSSESLFSNLVNPSWHFPNNSSFKSFTFAVQ